MMWDETGLSRLQAQLTGEMLGQVTAFMLGYENWLVRGVVSPPDRRGVGRVVLWDGQRLDTSVAFDVPLTDDHGTNIPSADLAAALRKALADCSARDIEEAPRDTFGFPLINAATAVRAFVAQPRFHVADALHAAAAAFCVCEEPEEPAELRLRGFLLLDRATYRLYLDTPTTEDAPPFGVDLPLRDAEDSVAPGVTAAHTALPVLMLGELERMRKNVHDPYGRAVYDLVDWLMDR